jgi:hypothetical protein
MNPVSPLVLYNPIKGSTADVPQLPTAWITMHQSATSASLFAGAITYAFTRMAGTVTTSAVSKTVALSGAVLSEGARLVGGQTAAHNVKEMIDRAAVTVADAGSSATRGVSLMAAAAAAVTAGGTVMIGNVVGSVIYGAYKHMRGPPNPEISHAEEIVQSSLNNGDYEFIICDIRPIDSEPAAAATAATATAATATTATTATATATTATTATTAATATVATATAATATAATATAATATAATATAATATAATATAATATAATAGDEELVVTTVALKRIPDAADLDAAVKAGILPQPPVNF